MTALRTSTLMLTMASVALSGCGKVGNSQKRQEPAKVAQPRPAPSLAVTPRVLDKDRVELTITTNLPLPITVVNSIDLDGQAPTDTYIGYEGENTILRQPTTTIILDTSLATKRLPAGRYVASVGFYPRWGAKGNPEAGKAPELHANAAFTLGASGESVADATLRDRRRTWIMENLSPNTPWNKREFQRKLGPSERTRSDLSPLHDAYYYPGADATLIVNRVRGEVSIWRLGKATK